MLPTWNKTITVLHKTKVNNADVWTKAEYNNCFWTSSSIKLQSGNTTSITYTLTARFPYNSLDIAFNDYLILGSVTEKNINSNNVIAIVNSYKPNSMQVKSIKDNTSYNIPHLKIEGV